MRISSEIQNTTITGDNNESGILRCKTVLIKPIGLLEIGVIVNFRGLFVGLLGITNTKNMPTFVPSLNPGKIDYFRQFLIVRTLTCIRNQFKPLS